MTAFVASGLVVLRVWFVFALWGLCGGASYAIRMAFAALLTGKHICGMLAFMYIYTESYGGATFLRQKSGSHDHVLILQHGTLLAQHRPGYEGEIGVSLLSSNWTMAS